MPNRPTQLPDFSNPPVTEVVVGFQFNAIGKFVTAHVGLLWDEFKNEFPDAEEHPPVMPAFETFGQSSPLLSGMSFGFPGIFTMQRSFFVNQDKTQIVQVQKDKFLHNWRKTGEGDAYPRFERILHVFQQGLERFTSFVTKWDLGPLEPNQCEVTYINQVPLLAKEEPYAAMTRIFDGLIGHPNMSELGFPNDARLLLRYIIPGVDGDPIGRLTISAEPAKRVSGDDIIQISLTARGAPMPADVSGVMAFLQEGRIHIVRGFTSITSSNMHAVWGRKQ